MKARERTPSTAGNPVTTQTTPGTPAIAERPSTGTKRTLATAAMPATIWMQATEETPATTVHQQQARARITAIS
jgi:hypothetical protein